MSLISSWSWSRTEPPPNSPSPPCRWLLPRLSPVRDSFLFSDAVADFGVKPGGTYGTSVDSYRGRQRPSPAVAWLVGCVTGSVTRCLTRWIQCSPTRIYGHRQASRVVWRDVEQDREQPPPVGTPPLLLGASHPATPLPRSNSYGDETAGWDGCLVLEASRRLHRDRDRRAFGAHLPSFVTLRRDSEAHVTISRSLVSLSLSLSFSLSFFWCRNIEIEQRVPRRSSTPRSSSTMCRAPRHRLRPSRSARCKYASCSPLLRITSNHLTAWYGVCV